MRFKWLSVEKDKSHTDSCEDLNSLKMMNDMLRYYYCCCMKMIEAKLVCKVVAIEEDQRRGYRGPNARPSSTVRWPLPPPVQRCVQVVWS